MILEKDKFQLKNWELVSINPNEKKWDWSDFFNYWAVSVQSVIGFSLIASIYMMYDLNSFVVLSGSIIASLLIFLLI